jgi:hypothetical protein
MNVSSILLGMAAVFNPLAQDPLIQNIHSRVLETIEHSESIPDLKGKEFCDLKDGIVARWHELVQNGVLEVTGTDEEVRPYFVALQGIVEHVLALELNKEVKALVGVIHTPMPATPLCTDGSISNDLVDPSVTDPYRLFTVKLRASIIRTYLGKCADLYICYPRDGLSRRKPEQQKIYHQELENHSSHLFDRPLDCQSIDSDLIGAFYLFTNKQGKTFAFAIKMTQVNNPQDIGNFSLWFGELDHPAIKDRVTKVKEFIMKFTSKPIDLYTGY